MNELTRLQADGELTEIEASEILRAWTKRHTGMLDNLLRIKAETPEDGERGSFRRQRPGSVSLEQLRQILQDFSDALTTVSKQESTQTPSLLSIIEATHEKLKILYEGQSTAFAVILNELTTLENVLLQRFSKVELETSTSTNVVSMEKPADKTMNVYVRVFHRQLSQLPLPDTDKTWLKTLLDSVRESEKHGLAVYADEADVKRSIRGENDGYVTVAITAAQDITHQRRAKQDPQLLCPLLTIGPIRLAQLKKLTYADVDYLIQDGIIRKASA